jgi:hypothetical protein
VETAGRVIEARASLVGHVVGDAAGGGSMDLDAAPAVIRSSAEAGPFLGVPSSIPRDK